MRRSYFPGNSIATTKFAPVPSVPLVDQPGRLDAKKPSLLCVAATRAP